MVKIILVLVDWYRILKLFLYDLSFKKRHYTFKVEKGHFKINSMSHEDFISITQEKINGLSKEKKVKEIIKLALEEAINGCNFVIFQVDNNKNKFVQFWTDNKKLGFDFPLSKACGFDKYYYPILGLIKSFELENETFLQRNKFKIKDEIFLGYKTIKVNFGKDIDLASDFVEKVFKEVFRIKNFQLTAEVN